MLCLASFPGCMSELAASVLAFSGCSQTQSDTVTRAHPLLHEEVPGDGAEGDCTTLAPMQPCPYLTGLCLNTGGACTVDSCRQSIVHVQDERAPAAA